MRGKLLTEFKWWICINQQPLECFSKETVYFKGLLQHHDEKCTCLMSYLKGRSCVLSSKLSTKNPCWTFTQRPVGLHLGQCVVFLFWSRETWLAAWFFPPSDSSCGGCLPHADFADAALPLEEPQRSACFDVNKKKRNDILHPVATISLSLCVEFLSLGRG